MKKLFLITILMFVSTLVFSQTYKTNAVNNNFTGYNKFSATKLKVGNTAVTETKVKQWDSTYNYKVQLNTLVPMLADSGDTYATPYDLSQVTGGGSVGFATYDSLSTDSTYFNTLTHQLRVRHGGWWYGFTPSDSTEIYVAPVETLGEELVDNGDFSGGLTSWDANYGGSVSNGEYTCTDAGGWGYIARQAGLGFIQGHTYRVTFDVISLGAEGYIVLNNVTGSSWITTTGSYTCDVVSGADINGGQFSIGNHTGGSNTITIDNVSIKEVL